MADERESRLPAWARDELNRLRTGLSVAEGEIKAINEENERLRVLVTGKYIDKETDADTFLVQNDIEGSLPLGAGVEVRFADFYSVRYGEGEAGDAKVLVIETDESMQIRPSTSYTIVVAHM
jgi:hypothetical protein